MEHFCTKHIFLRGAQAFTTIPIHISYARKLQKFFKKVLGIPLDEVPIDTNIISSHLLYKVKLTFAATVVPARRTVCTYYCNLPRSATGVWPSFPISPFYCKLVRFSEKFFNDGCWELGRWKVSMAVSDRFLSLVNANYKFKFQSDYILAAAHAKRNRQNSRWADQWTY